MTDNAPVTASPSTVPPAPAATTPKSHLARNALVLTGCVVVSVCMCVSACFAALFAYGTYLNNERPKVEQVIDAYMSAMEAKGPKAAYALFSARAQNVVSLADLEEMLDGNNYKLFENYQAAIVDAFTVTLTTNTNPNAPQGTIALVQGRLIYDDDITGQYQATLEYVDGQWWLDGINVTVPPAKFGP